MRASEEETAESIAQLPGDLVLPPHNAPSSVTAPRPHQAA